MGCCWHMLSNIELRHCYTRPAPEHDNKSAETLLALAEKASLLSNLATAVASAGQTRQVTDRSIGLSVNGRQSSKSCVHNIGVIHGSPTSRCWVSQGKSTELQPAPILYFDGRCNASKVNGRAAKVTTCIRCSCNASWFASGRVQKQAKQSKVPFTTVTRRPAGTVTPSGGHVAGVSLMSRVFTVDSGALNPTYTTKLTEKACT